MYHPTRGGVRGGSDQFSWETVKTDKYRENYLGHSLKAPIGRWQKGKDLSWYAKERKNASDVNNTALINVDEREAIKKAEEEAMLIALGFKTAKQSGQALGKEEMIEALKRNQGSSSCTDAERIEGIGIESARASMLINQGKSKKDGVMFETKLTKDGRLNTAHQNSEPSMVDHSSEKHRAKSRKKHKKEKRKKKTKKRKHRKGSSDVEAGEKDIISSSRHKKHVKLKKNKRCNRGSSSDSESTSESEIEIKNCHSTHTDAKHKRTVHHSSSNSTSTSDQDNTGNTMREKWDSHHIKHKNSTRNSCIKQNCTNQKRQRHDTSSEDSDHDNH